MDDENNVEQMEEEENVCTSDDNSDGGLDLNKEWVNYTFSDLDDDDDIASVDHLSEEEEEIREVRLRKVTKEGKTVNAQNVELINVQQVRLGKELSNNENVMVDDDGTLLSEDIVEVQSYEHDEFLTEICDGYERDMFVEEEVNSDNENVMADEDEKDNTNKFPIHNPHIPWNLMKPQVCERYASAAELKTCLTNYAIANGLQLRYLKNTKKKLLVVCGPSKPGEERSCPWRLWASSMSTEKSFQVKTLHDEHRCGRNYRLGSLVNSNWIAKQYGRKIRQNPSMKLVDLRESILKKYKCIVTMGQCSRAKAKALGEVETALVEHYGKLWDYGEEIMRSNPGSTVKMSVEVGPDQKNYFQRFYVCLKGVKEGWLSGCRKFIGLDGCFLKTICKGELLSAVGRDANNQIYPLAWAVVEVESKNSWKWFLEYLMEDIGLTAGLGVTIMSDQHKGLVEAVKDVFPLAEHRQCARHIYANFRKKYTGIQFRALFWAASKAGTPEEFQCVMQEIKDLSDQAFNHLMERHPNTWSRAFFKTETSCDAVENGVSECFNSLIVSSRRKPIITMLEEIRVFIMERIENMNKKSCKWNDEICPAIRKKLEKNKEQMRFWRVVPNGGDQFEVRQGLEGYVVDTRERTCTCRIWQLSGIPCPHAVASIYFIHMEPEVFVSDFFSRSYFIATYNHKVNPLNGLKLWPKTDYLKPLPPRVRRMPGRPSVSRKKDASESGYRSKSNKYGNEEVTKVGRQMTCKNCWEVGHNSRGCKNQKRDAPTKQRNPTGRPKGRMPQVPQSVSESGSRGRGSTATGSVSRRGSRGRGSMGTPHVVVGEAIVGSSQVIADKDVQVSVNEGAPSLNEPMEPTEPTGIVWSEFADMLLSDFGEDNGQLEAILTSGQDMPSATPSERTKRLKM